jgi:hypothetical protein
VSSWAVFAKALDAVSPTLQSLASATKPIDGRDPVRSPGIASQRLADARGIPFCRWLAYWETFE